jgi:hypothetical protein
MELDETSADIPRRHRPRYRRAAKGESFRPLPPQVHLIPRQRLLDLLPASPTADREQKSTDANAPREDSFPEGCAASFQRSFEDLWDRTSCLYVESSLYVVGWIEGCSNCVFFLTSFKPSSGITSIFDFKASQSMSKRAKFD